MGCQITEAATASVGGGASEGSTGGGAIGTDVGAGVPAGMGVAI